MKEDKDADLAQRAKDARWDIELFRVVHGRLPNQEGDRVTKKTAKEYLNRFFFGKETLDIKYDKNFLTQFAFHVYASTNLAYENDLVSPQPSKKEG
jgi:hypothetical protein